METLKVGEEKGLYQFQSFSNFPVVAGFSDRTFNMRFAEDLQPGATDRTSFCELLQVPAADLVCPEQVHSASIVLVSEEMKGRGAFSRENTVSRADGMIVKEKGIPLGVQTADCSSLFFYDPAKDTAGVAHVGWRGLYAGLPGKMVAAFTNNFLCRPKDLYVGIGPMIRKCCYEVGEDVAALFAGFVTVRKGKNYLELSRAIIAGLQSMGISRKHIEDSGFCTSCRNELFYSYRREGSLTGRMLSVIMLR